MFDFDQHVWTEVPPTSFQILQFCKLRAQLHSEFLFAADLPILDASFAFTCGLACTPSVLGNRVCAEMVAEVEASAQGSLGRRGDRAAVVRLRTRMNNIE